MQRSDGLLFDALHREVFVCCAALALPLMLTEPLAADAVPLHEGGHEAARVGTGDPVDTPTPVPSCAFLPNGSFNQSLTGWSVLPATSHDPGSFCGASVSVVDGSPLIAPMDHSVARLTGYAVADGSLIAPGESAAADAEIVLSTIVPVTDRYLRLTIAGGWEVLFFAAAGFAMDVRVEVRGPAGQLLTHHVDHLTNVIEQECGFGLSVLGMFNIRSPHIVMDLLEDRGRATGIRVDDSVEVRIMIHGSASAHQECEYAEVAVSLFVDDFQFCSHPALPADLDGDGIVGGLDLAMLLGQWGPCIAKSITPKSDLAIGGSFCTGDLDGSGSVDGLDLALLLGQWG